MKELALNIPRSRVKYLTDKYKRLMQQADELLFEAHEVKAQIRAATRGTGNWGDVTVYKVRGTTVQSYRRRSFVAMRVARLTLHGRATNETLE